MSYRVEVRGEFSGNINLRLPGGEVARHHHRYHLAVSVEGERLDEYGFLIDIVALQTALEKIIDGLGSREQLNGDPLFGDANPTLERLAEALARELAGELDTEGLTRLTVEAFESEQSPSPGPSARFTLVLTEPTS